LLAGGASAQEEPLVPSQTTGLIVGMVARCVTGVEQPAVGASVGVEGGSATLTRTDTSGQFILALPPGQYTIAHSDAHTDARRSRLPADWLNVASRPGAPRILEKIRQATCRVATN
jgi:hypothetical protein